MMTETSAIENRPQLSDLDLVRRAQIEDISAYEQLVRRYHSKIYGLIYGMTSNCDDTEGLVQEVFAKAWAALSHLREQVGFYTWIHRIAINRTHRFRKRRTHRGTVRFEDFDPEVKQSDSYKEFSQKGAILRKMRLSEFQKKMNEALLTLSEKYRATLIMHDVQGMSSREIAKVMNGSEAATLSRLDHARKKLIAQLADPDIDVVGLLSLKVYERPGVASSEKNIKKTMHAVRAAHKRPSLLFFPDKSMAWMFAQPRYGVAALFILFLVLHLAGRPVPQDPVDTSPLDQLAVEIEQMVPAETNVVPTVSAVHPSLIKPAPFSSNE